MLARNKIFSPQVGSSRKRSKHDREGALLISFAIVFVGVALVLGFGVGVTLGYRAAVGGG